MIWLLHFVPLHGKASSLQYMYAFAQNLLLLLDVKSAQNTKWLELKLNQGSCRISLYCNFLFLFYYKLKKNMMKNAEMRSRS